MNEITLLTPAPDPREGEPGTSFPWSVLAADVVDAVAANDPNDSRRIAIRFQRADGVAHDVSFSVPSLIWRGMWSSDETYTLGDVVAWNGASWVASTDCPDTAPAAGPGWALLAKQGKPGPRGQTGARGEKGEQGEPGADGAPGADIVDAFLEQHLLMFEKSDGTLISVDVPELRTKAYPFNDDEPPLLFFRGIFQQGVEYRRGDLIRQGSVLYLAEEPTRDLPGAMGSEGWAMVLSAISTGSSGGGGGEGEQGPPGPPGPQGPQGNDGAPGPAGPQGPQGVVGPAGPPGTDGADGAPGPAGPQGPQGPAGTGINMKGQVPTVADLPAGATQGDAWIVQETGDLWSWNGTAWINLGPIQGPQGAPGPQGVAGPAGPQGPQGAVGPQGVQGVQGVKGDTGDAGPAGPAGPQGPPGADGDEGAQGPAGPQGPQGLPGNDGATGPQGPQGIAGPQGLKGDTGATGPAGPQGPAGADGDDGAPGATGPAGPAGATGPQGDPGPQGPAGATGGVGPAGATGPAGPGVAAAGTTGQMLVKASATDFATTWADPFTQTAADARYVNVSGDSMTGALLGANGTQVAPAFAFASDPGTGMFRPAGSNIRFASGGVETLTLNQFAVTSALPFYTTLGGTAADPRIAQQGANFNTGLFWPTGALGFSQGGVERMRLSATAMTTTVPTLGPDGTPVAPAFAFAGDAGTGMFRIGASQIGFALGGVGVADWNATRLTLGSQIYIARSNPAVDLDTGSPTDFSNRSIIGRTGGALRWSMQLGAGVESGSNTGGDFILTRGDDAGAALGGTTLRISRATGNIGFGAIPNGNVRMLIQDPTDLSVLNMRGLRISNTNAGADGSANLEFSTAAGALRGAVTGLREGASNHGVLRLSSALSGVEQPAIEIASSRQVTFLGTQPVNLPAGVDPTADDHAARRAWVLAQIPVSGGPVLRTLAADFVSAAVALASVTGMNVPVLANQKWKIEVFGRYRTAATTTGAGMSLLLPAGATINGVSRIRQAANGTDSFYEAELLASDQNFASASVVAANTEYACLLSAVVTIGATAGDIALRWRSEVAASDATLRAGAEMIATRVA